MNAYISSMGGHSRKLTPNPGAVSVSGAMLDQLSKACVTPVKEIGHALKQHKTLKSSGKKRVFSLQRWVVSAAFDMWSE